jgi:hypothetical protein
LISGIVKSGSVGRRFVGADGFVLHGFFSIFFPHGCADERGRLRAVRAQDGTRLALLPALPLGIFHGLE